MRASVELSVRLGQPYFNNTPADTRIIGVMSTLYPPEVSHLFPSSFFPHLTFDSMRKSSSSAVAPVEAMPLLVSPAKAFM
jgi:hypothetical protein